MDDGNLAVLVDAKTEYTKQLVNVLKGYMYGVFLELFNETSEEYPENIFFEYQKKLSQIPKWNTEMINDHCEALIAKSKCDWIDELVTAVFVSHTRILTSINFSKNKGKIDLNIPKTNNFIHKCFIDIARYFWKNAYLFDKDVSKFEYQKNRRDSEILIEKSINETIRKELPVKNILKKYLGSDFQENTVVDDSVTDENIRKLVMRELENCSEEKLNKMKLVLDGNAEAVAPEPEEESKPVVPEPVLQELTPEETLKGEVINLESEPEPIESISLDLNTLEPEAPAPVAAPEPVPAPLVAVEPEPLVAVEPEPLVAHEPAPVVAPEPAPVAAPEPALAASVVAPEPAPLAGVEPVKTLDMEPVSLESLDFGEPVDLDNSPSLELEPLTDLEPIDISTSFSAPQQTVEVAPAPTPTNVKEITVDLSSNKKKNRNHTFFE